MRNTFSKILIACLLVTLGVSLAVSAQEIEIENPLGEGSTLWTLISRIARFIRMISLAIAVVFFILSGYRFIFAAGDPEKVQTAKKMVLWTIIGLMVVLAAEGIIDLVVNEILNVN